MLVFDDADLEKAVEGAMLAKFRNTGQSCIAANRIYVQRGFTRSFSKLFVEKTKALKVGDGLEPDVQIGAMIDEDGRQKGAGTRGGCGQARRARCCAAVSG